MVADISGHTAELNRKAHLQAHIYATLEKALRSLRNGNPDEALEVISEASTKYSRLGGPPPEDNEVFMARSCRDYIKVRLARARRTPRPPADPDSQTTER